MDAKTKDAGDCLFNDSPTKDDAEYHEVDDNDFYCSIALTDADKVNFEAFKEMFQKFNYIDMEQLPKVK